MELCTELFFLFFIFYCKQISAEVSKHNHQGVAKNLNYTHFPPIQLFAHAI